MKKINLENKWLRAAIPALLVHVCIGSVYCWSLLKDSIAAAVGCNVSSIEIAFSLAIFFLGMSAAFMGNFVERNVKESTLISTMCFVAGLAGTVLSIELKSIAGVLLSYGALMGIGLGVGYLSPVKTLMLWFSEHKGLATGIAISGFGLSKVIFSPFIEWCIPTYGIVPTLFSMGGISAVLMSTSALLIRKPEGWVEPKVSFDFNKYKKVLMNPTYLMIWFIFYLNITCGLALISFEKSIGNYVGVGSIAVLSALTAFFNTMGRFGYSTISDYTKKKETIYKIIFTSSLIMMACVAMNMSLVATVVALCIINAGYGGGFSTLPTLLQSKFGMKNISTIHGLTLSAWAMAGLSGNQLSNFIINKMGWGYNTLLWVLCGLYTLALVFTSLIAKDEKTYDV